MSTYEWKKKNLKTYGPNFPISSGIPAAITQYANDHAMAETAVITQAVKEKLAREGYWKPPEKPEE